MAREIEEFMTKVINKNTGETEFHQAVREVIELILAAQGKWQKILQDFS